MIKPGDCSLSPEILLVTASQVLGLQACITILGCCMKFWPSNSRSSYLQGQPYSNGTVSLAPLFFAYRTFSMNGFVSVRIEFVLIDQKPDYGDLIQRMEILFYCA